MVVVVVAAGAAVVVVVGAGVSVFFVLRLARSPFSLALRSAIAFGAGGKGRQLVFTSGWASLYAVCSQLHLEWVHQPRHHHGQPTARAYCECVLTRSPHVDHT